jgi:hypothetical protein
MPIDVIRISTDLCVTPAPGHSTPPPRLVTTLPLAGGGYSNKSLMSTKDMFSGESGGSGMCPLISLTPKIAVVFHLDVRLIHDSRGLEVKGPRAQAEGWQNLM